MILQTKINVYCYILLRFCGCLFCSVIVAINNGDGLLSKKIFLLTPYLVEKHWVIHFASELYRFALLSSIVRV